MMEDNVPGFPGYHVTRSGNVYSKRVVIINSLD